MKKNFFWWRERDKSGLGLREKRRGTETKWIRETQGKKFCQYGNRGLGGPLKKMKRVTLTCASCKPSLVGSGPNSSGETQPFTYGLLLAFWPNPILGFLEYRRLLFFLFHRKEICLYIIEEEYARFTELSKYLIPYSHVFFSCACIGFFIFRQRKLWSIKINHQL